MNIKTAGFALIAAFVISGCASTGEADNQQADQGAEKAQSTSKAPKDPNEVICKMIKKTGTSIKSKVCGTRAEWAAAEREGEDFMRDL